MKRTVLVFMAILMVSSAFGQRKGKGCDFRFWADSLDRLRVESMTARTEVERYSLNEDFTNLLELTLNEENSFKFGWDSVKNFSVLTSPDKLFKIFTWFIPKDDYTVENFGFIQVYNDGRKKYVLYPLFDRRVTMDYPKTTIGNQNKWYGAVYYNLIPMKTKNRTYYTLLGWNGNDLFTNQKVIEVLYFKQDMSPVFGANIFKKYNEKAYRIIFEYAKNSVFSLKYENHTYDVGTGKRDPKTHTVIYETMTADMIIFDDIAPLDDFMGNVAAFMVPESSLNHGFIQDNGKWLYLNSVNGRNPDKDKPAHQVKAREYYNPNN